MGSSSGASLNGLSSAIPNVFHSCALSLLTESKKCDFFFNLKKKSTEFLKRVKDLDISVSYLHLQGCCYTSMP